MDKLIQFTSYYLASGFKLIADMGARAIPGRVVDQKLLNHYWVAKYLHTYGAGDCFGIQHKAMSKCDSEISEIMGNQRTMKRILKSTNKVRI